MSPFARRLLTIPGYFLLFGVVVATLPVTLALAVAVDAVRRTPLALTRAVLFFAWYLGCEVAGLLAAFGLWVWKRARRPSREAWLERNVALKCWWARQLLRGARLCFGLRVEAEGLEALHPGPYLLFMRHASTADTILTSVLLTDRLGIDFRHVIKKELLWDPCLDVAGHRLPNYFVDRDAADSAREIDGIRRLAADLGPGHGVMIYPEGTRFTEAKRARVLEKIEARGDAELLARARSLRHVLPPRLGGPLGLLEAAPGVDVLVCAHVGFDGIQSFAQFLDGGLVNRTARVAYWTVPAGRVPPDRDARIDWLFEQWQQVDRWVAAHRKPEA